MKNRILVFVSAVFLITCVEVLLAEESPAIRLDERPESPFFGTFEAVNLDRGLLADLASRDVSNEEWQSVFAVYTGSVPPADSSDVKPAVAGTYAIEDRALRFRPRYPLVAGLTYSARLDWGADPIVASFSWAREETSPTTKVTAFYPSASELPENLLRIYLHFSAPMSRGEAYEHVRLYEEPSGREIDRPFVEIAEELWDPQVRRLTLLFDPGRIKRGLRSHEQVGPPLSAGASYRLVVDPGWPDARGRPLREAFEKRFTTFPADRVSPNPDTWRLEAPAAGSRQGVVLTFSEPLDHALLRRVLRVRDGGGRLLAGRVEVSDNERRWTFSPEDPWAAGNYEIEVEAILEDLAGNNLKHVFDVDLKNRSEERIPGDRISLEFTVSGSTGSTDGTLRRNVRDRRPRAAG